MDKLLVFLLTFLGYTFSTLFLICAIDDLPIDINSKYFYWKILFWPIYFPCWLICATLKWLYCDLIIKNLDNWKK